MSKVAVVYWSGTGNTEAMANKVAEGAKAAGAEVEVISTFWFLWLGRRRVDAQLGREMPERWRCTCC